MKKNSTSRVFVTGRIDNAYAAGTASTRTSSVDVRVVNTEFSRYGQKPEPKTPANCSRVGAKITFGVSVDASTSCLKPVITIHSTGKKNSRPTSQVSVVRPRDPTLPHLRAPGLLSVVIRSP